MTTDKPLGDLIEADLQQLIADGVMEGKRIEYKQAVELDKDDAKRKFLASIASFANASGGDLIFGIKAENGKPTGIVPLAALNPDAMKLRMVQLIRDGIEPKVFGIEFREISLAAGGHTFVIRIPKTFLGVHMVTYNKDNRFYARGANGRVLMDIAEIKGAFTLGESTIDKVRKWRTDRLAIILADETPRQMELAPRVVVHVVPLCAFDVTFTADLSPIYHDLTNLIPLGTESGTVTVDFEGVFCYADFKGNGKADSYNYVFRNGCIESASSAMLAPWRGPSETRIYGRAVESRIIDFSGRVTRLFKQIGVEAPFFVALSFLNVKGFTMAVADGFYSGLGHPVNKDHLFLPEVFVESLSFNAREILRESFYRVWNACGWPRSHNYDKDGNWIGGQ